MSGYLDGVKIKSYHHGALRPALIAAGEAVLAERGLEGFSLRETARRAGVSASAPAHHFGDARGLLTAIAELALCDLTEALEVAAREAVRTDRLKKLATTYVQFAVRQRAQFDLMWRSTLLDPDNREFREAQARAFHVFDRAVMGIDRKVEIPSDPALAPSVALWSLAHGFARLAIDGAFGPGEPAINRAIETLLPAVLQSAGCSYSRMFVEWSLAREPGLRAWPSPGSSSPIRPKQAVLQLAFVTAACGCLVLLCAYCLHNRKSVK